jgi:hypothetical protein
MMGRKRAKMMSRMTRCALGEERTVDLEKVCEMRRLRAVCGALERKVKMLSVLGGSHQ